MSDTEKVRALGRAWKEVKWSKGSGWFSTNASIDKFGCELWELGVFMKTFYILLTETDIAGQSHFHAPDTIRLPHTHLLPKTPCT